MTSAAGSGTGRRRSSRVSNSEKMALVTPMPSPSDRTATADTSGRRVIDQAAWRTSCRMVSSIEGVSGFGTLASAGEIGAVGDR